MITFKIEVEQEEDGRWLAEVLELPGVLAYGQSQGPRSRRYRLWLSEWLLNVSSTAKLALSF